MALISQATKILEAFKSYNKLSLSSLYEMFPDMSENTIRRRVLDLAKDGLIESEQFRDGIYHLKQEAITSEIEALRKELHG